MHTHIRLCTTAFLILYGALTVLPEPLSILALKNNGLNSNLFPFLFNVPLKRGIAKATDLKKDSMVISHIDRFYWNGVDWERDRYEDFSYDSKGRVIEKVINSESDSTIEQESFEYDPNEISIQRTIRTLSRPSSKSELNRSKLIYSFYPTYRNVSINNIFYPWNSEIGEGETPGWTVPDIDSMKNWFMLWNSTQNIWDTVNLMKYHYNIIDEHHVHIHFTEESYWDDMVIIDWTFEWTVKPGEDEETDTLLKQTLDADGNQVEFSKLISRFDAKGRFVGMTYEAFYAAKGVWKMILQVSNTYNSSGYMETSTTQLWDSATVSWMDEEKFVVSYASIPLSSIEKSKKLFTIPGLTATWKNGSVRLAAGSRLRITGVIMFDLQGRVIDRIDDSFYLDSGESVALPWMGRGSAMRVIQVRTDRSARTFHVSAD